MTTDQIYSKNSLTRPSSLLYSVLSLKFLTLLFIIDEWLLLKPFLTASNTMPKRSTSFRPILLEAVTNNLEQLYRARCFLTIRP